MTIRQNNPINDLLMLQWDIANVPKYRYYLPHYLSDNDWSNEAWLNQRPDEAPVPTERDYTMYDYLVPEAIYREYEAKLNGNYLLGEDGTTWTGDPRVWAVMLMDNFRKRYRANPYYTGIENKQAISDFLNGIGWKWLSDNYGAGNAYAHIYTWNDEAGTPIGNRFEDVVDENGNLIQNPALYDRGYNFMVGVPRNLKTFIPPNMKEIAAQLEWGIPWNYIPYSIDGNGKLVYDPEGGMTTDEIVAYAQENGLGSPELYNIIDGWAGETDTPITPEQLNDYYNTSIEARDAVWPMLNLTGEIPYNEVIVEPSVNLPIIPGNTLEFNGGYRKEGGKLITKTV